MSDKYVTERMEKNLDAIRTLVGELNRVVSEYNLVAISGKADYGHVGDVARIRTLLNEALHNEDKDPV